MKGKQLINILFNPWIIFITGLLVIFGFLTIFMLFHFSFQTKSIQFEKNISDIKHDIFYIKLFIENF